MTDHPRFPRFRPVSLQDRAVIHERLRDYQPDTSELTFTNLFIWQAYHKPHWSLYRDWLFIVNRAPDGELYAMQPVGPPPRAQAARELLVWLREEKAADSPRIERADSRFVAEIGDGFAAEPQRDHFDYVYASRDLCGLAGRKYHAKKNHVNKFTNTHSFVYAPLGPGHVGPCREMEDQWCRTHHCCDDMSLTGEWDALHRCLTNIQELDVRGGVILVEGRVEAFAVGELLNRNTAVVHVEKANPSMPELYAVMNQQFCEHAWNQVTYINREQDLGQEGLRRAKLSYHPHHFAEKFRVELR